MIIRNEGHIVLRIHSILLNRTVIISRNKWLQEANLVRDGSKGLQQQCKVPHPKVVAMTIMADKVIWLMHRHLILFLVLALPLLLWAHLLHREITITDSHMVRSISKLHIPNLHLLRVTAMDAMKQNMKTRLRVIIPMEEIHSHEAILKALIQAILSRHHLMACHHMDLLPKSMASTELVNQVICLIKVPSHRPNLLMVKMCHLSRHPPMRQVGPHSKLINSHMVLHLLLMVKISRHLLLYLPSKVVSQF
ncbi:hypothetical protein ACSBR1_030644 [Camellia fascicularis]